MEFNILEFDNGLQKIPINSNDSNTEESNKFFTFIKAENETVESSQKRHPNKPRIPLNNDKEIEVEEEEEEINSDEYISSSMLDVDTNTYINQTIVNKSKMELLNDNTLDNDYKIKQTNKKEININISPPKDNINNSDYHMINFEENNSIKNINNNNAYDKNNIIPPKKFFDYNSSNNNNSKGKIKENKEYIIDNEIPPINLNSINDNKTNNSNNKVKKIKNNKSIDNKINNNNNIHQKANIDLEKYNNLITKKNNEKNIYKYNKKANSKKNNINNIINTNTNYNEVKIKRNKNEYSNNYILNEKLLKDLSTTKNGQNYKILKNSKSIKIEKTKGRLTTSPKIETTNKNINKSNINLDILKKLKNNNSKYIIDGDYKNRSSISKVYIKKVAKNINNIKNNDSPSNKKSKINSSISDYNKKVDLLKNNKINKEIINYLQNKKILNYKESFDKKEINKGNKSKSKSNGKEKNVKIKSKNKKIQNIEDKSNKINLIRKLKCFNSFYPKKTEKKLFKYLNKEQFLTFSNNNISNNNKPDNSNTIEFNKSIDLKKINDLSSKKYKFRIKQKRNLSTDIDFIMNNTPDKVYKIYNKNELKNKYLFHIIRKSNTLSNRSQNIDNKKKIKSNNSKFNLRNNNSLYDFSNKFNKNKINAFINDNTFNYIFIPKSNKSSERYYGNYKYNINSLLENRRFNSSSNKKANNDVKIYRKIMKNFYNYRKNNNINTNIHYQNIYGKNNAMRKTDYKRYSKNNNINYSISNNINNHINNININTSNNLINFITNITSGEDYHSLSGNISTKKSIAKKNIKHNLISSIINDPCVPKRKIKKENDFSNIISNKLIKLYTIDSKFSKKKSLESHNLINLENKLIKTNDDSKKIKNEINTLSTINNKNNNTKNVYNFRDFIKKINKNNIDSNSFKNNEYKKIKNKKDNNLLNMKNKIFQVNSERNNYKNKNSNNKYNYLNDNKNKKV